MVQVRQKGTSEVFCELDLRKEGIDRASTQNLKLKNRKVIEFLKRQEKILEREEEKRAMKPLEGEEASLKEESVPSGVSQKPKLKSRKWRNLFKKAGGERKVMTPLEEAAIPAQSSENASRSSSTSLPEIAVEEGVLEVGIRIEKFCKNSDGSEGARTVIYDENLCTLKTLKDLIYFDDFALGELCQNENNTYTLKLTGLRDTSSLIVTEGEEIADESRS